MTAAPVARAGDPWGGGTLGATIIRKALAAQARAYASYLEALGLMADPPQQQTATTLKKARA